MKKKLLVLGGLAIAAIGIVGTQLRPNDTLPDFEIPAKKLPSPNGYDFYVKAGKALTPAPKNLDATFDSQNIPEANWKTAYPVAKKEAWLAQNAGALKTMRQGFHYQSLVPPRHTTKELANTSLADFRSLARLLVVESRVHGERGRWGAAGRSATDILRLAHGIARGGMLLDSLYANAIEHLGQAELARIKPHLNSDEAAQTAKTLEKLYQNRETHAEFLRNEKLSGQALMLEAMKLPDWQDAAQKKSASEANLLQRWRMSNSSRPVIFDNYSKYMDALISNAKKPYDTQTQAPPAPQDFYNRRLGQAYSTAYWLYTRQDARNALSLVAMALQAHKLYYNSYPESLSALSPRYLQKIPTDPFAAGKALHYRPSGDKYLLYSVGPNGKDDGGSDLVVNDEKLQQPGGLAELINSKGDITIDNNGKSSQW